MTLADAKRALAAAGGTLTDLGGGSYRLDTEGGLHAQGNGLLDDAMLLAWLEVQIAISAEPFRWSGPKAIDGV